MKTLPVYTLLLFVISCTAPGAKEQTQTALGVAVPEEVGLIADSLDLIEEHLQWAMDSQFVAGGVALVYRNGKIAYHRAFGFRDREKTDPLTTDDIFRMASMTKPVTTVAVMQLVEQGKLKVDDPVSKYIPEFADAEVLAEFNEADKTWTTRPAQNVLTIHHLLTHTSGIGYGVFDPVAAALYAPHEVVEVWTKDSVTLAGNIPKLGKAPLLHEPGTRFTYGMSIDVLGYIVERVSGLPLDDYMTQNIFEPLGMEDTGFYLPQEKADRLVEVWYTPDFNADQLNGGSPEDYPIAGAQTYFAGGAGLSSTSEDYLKFAGALLNGGSWDGAQILKPETVTLMMQNQIDTVSFGEGEKFGYGGLVHTADGRFGIKEGTFGWDGYWQTHFRVDPKQNMVRILLTNAQNVPKWNQMFDRFDEITNHAVVQ